jgi:hypothetical protein
LAKSVSSQCIDGRTVLQVRVRRVVRIVGIALGVLVVVALGAVVLVMSTIGDPPYLHGVPIVNRTDQHLKVYSLLPTVDPDMPDRLLIAEIPPNGMAESSGPCIFGPHVARAPDRTVVARIGPFDYCYKGPWIIRPVEPEP